MTDLEYYVADKVQCQTSEILVTRHAQVGGKTLNSSVRDCRVGVSGDLFEGPATYHCYDLRRTISTK